MPDADGPVGPAEDNGHEDFVEVVDSNDGMDDGMGDDMDGYDDMDEPEDDDITDDFGDDEVDFYDDQPNEGDFDGDSEWTPDENDGDFDSDFNDEFYGDEGNKDYFGDDWMTLFAVFSFGWFLCGASLLGWSCHYHRQRANAKVQWRKVGMIDEGNEEDQQMIAGN